MKRYADLAFLAGCLVLAILLAVSAELLMRMRGDVMELEKRLLRGDKVQETYL